MSSSIYLRKGDTGLGTHRSRARHGILVRLHFSMALSHAMASLAAPTYITRLELRHRALGLQRRRFWREVTYGSILVFADVLTLAAVFALAGMLPLDGLMPSLGEGAETFLRGLIPQTTIALSRRVTSLLFCLFVTRSYAHTERNQLSGRIFAALLLGLVLPRWAETWTVNIHARWLTIGAVVVATWIAMVLQRRGITEALRPIDPRRLDPSRTLLVGPATDVRAVTHERRDPELDEGRGPDESPTFVLSPAWPTDAADSMRELYEALAESSADAIVLVGALSDAALQAVMIAASSAGASVYATRRAAFRQLDEPSFVLRREEPLALLSRPALVGSQLVAKRLIDLAGAALVLVILFPVLALVAIAVRLTSPGPAVFRQIRVGLGGEPFMMYKFRTMVPDAESRQDTLERGNVYTSDPLFKMPHDPRTTRLGVFLRRSSLDELPQLLNVLRGEMSLVGPRPALPKEVARYQQHHFVRFEALHGSVAGERP
jgi:lipopolysaccharide/colanic/teichoic acid biosynthesis glycosyltransferase